jgi:hypothetical protein
MALHTQVTKNRAGPGFFADAKDSGKYSVAKSARNLRQLR